MPTNVHLDLLPKEFDKFRELIFQKSGISLHDGKRELVRTRLGSRLRELGISSYGEYYDLVAGDPTGNELVLMLDSISTNLTSFFRENGHFEFIRNQVVPEMIKRHQGSGQKELRIWSAGCSSGEEPYTLAFTLSDALRNLKGWNLKILATDISTQMLQRAASGKYVQEKIKTVPSDMLKRYMDRAGDSANGMYIVKPEIRKLIQSKRFNLMTPQFPFKKKFDFIMCRNVMIYFDKSTQETLVNKYYDTLTPGGYLLIGHSESLTGVSHRYKYIKPTIYKKQA
jgi:chemotaxis protein methyltransferase CheR